MTRKRKHPKNVACYYFATILLLSILVSQKVVRAKTTPPATTTGASRKGWAFWRRNNRRDAATADVVVPTTTLVGGGKDRNEDTTSSLLTNNNTNNTSSSSVSVSSPPSKTDDSSRRRKKRRRKHKDPASSSTPNDQESRDNQKSNPKKRRRISQSPSSASNSAAIRSHHAAASSSSSPPAQEQQQQSKKSSGKKRKRSQKSSQESTTVARLRKKKRVVRRSSSLDKQKQQEADLLALSSRTTSKIENGKAPFITTERQEEKTKDRLLHHDDDGPNKKASKKKKKKKQKKSQTTANNSSLDDNNQKTNDSSFATLAERNNNDSPTTFRKKRVRRHAATKADSRRVASERITDHGSAFQQDGTRKTAQKKKKKKRKKRSQGSFKSHDDEKHSIENAVSSFISPQEAKEAEAFVANDPSLPKKKKKKRKVKKHVVPNDAAAILKGATPPRVAARAPQQKTSEIHSVEEKSLPEEDAEIQSVSMNLVLGDKESKKKKKKRRKAHSDDNHIKKKKKKSAFKEHGDDDDATASSASEKEECQKGTFPAANNNAPASLDDCNLELPKKDTEAESMVKMAEEAEGDDAEDSAAVVVVNEGSLSRSSSATSTEAAADTPETEKETAMNNTTEGATVVRGTPREENGLERAGPDDDDVQSTNDMISTRLESFRAASFSESVSSDQVQGEANTNDTATTSGSFSLARNAFGLDSSPRGASAKDASVKSDSKREPDNTEPTSRLSDSVYDGEKARVDVDDHTKSQILSASNSQRDSSLADEDDERDGEEDDDDEDHVEDDNDKEEEEDKEEDNERKNYVSGSNLMIPSNESLAQEEEEGSITQAINASASASAGDIKAEPIPETPTLSESSFGESVSPPDRYEVVKAALDSSNHQKVPPGNNKTETIQASVQISLAEDLNAGVDVEESVETIALAQNSNMEVGSSQQKLLGANMTAVSKDDEAIGSEPEAGSTVEVSSSPHSDTCPTEVENNVEEAPFHNGDQQMTIEDFSQTVAGVETTDKPELSANENDLHHASSTTRGGSTMTARTSGQPDIARAAEYDDSTISSAKEWYLRSSPPSNTTKGSREAEDKAPPALSESPDNEKEAQTGTAHENVTTREEEHLTLNDASELDLDIEALASAGDDDENDICVSAVTWNLAEASPSEAEASFLRRFRRNGIAGRGSDLVLIAGQECENIKPRRSEGHRSREFRRLMVKMLGKEYVPIALHSLGGIQLGLFCRRSFLGDVESVSVADVTCGIGNVFHNKGAIGAFVQVKARQQSGRANALRMLFVSSHMAAHVKNADARDADFWRIMGELEAQAPPRFLSSKTNNVEGNDGSCLLDAMDRIFFCGDLNYRLDLPREHVITSILPTLNDEKRANDTFLELLRHDQLLRSIALKRAFPGFAEGKIAFLPTFKFDKESKEYDTSHKQRIPAWTDRVLFKPIGTRVLEYDSEPDAIHSDHRPVFATFRVSREGREASQKKRRRRRTDDPS